MIDIDRARKESQSIPLVGEWNTVLLIAHGCERSEFKIFGISRFFAFALIDLILVFSWGLSLAPAYLPDDFLLFC